MGFGGGNPEAFYFAEWGGGDELAADKSLDCSSGC
ncbi:hypothetical protein Enr8_34900 [Blastopirellula retiformator]|uniref:Uncharacterized protein n=1 Tax=Blastopirellula retiformator TaxID=2527970 RepID=A0A5C5UZM7_9BACT|nr:hypothetical protein Enr8_34900 [Blastopirellula retiformator]